MEWKVYKVRLPDGRVVPVRAPVGARDSDVKKAALADLKNGEFDFDVGDTARAGAQGLSFGFSDEIGAAIRAPFSDKKYGELRDESRFAMDRQRELHPWKTGGAELAGGLLTGGAGGVRAAGGMAARQGMKQIAGQGAKIGAGYGAAAGAGYGRSEDLAGMAKDTAIGAGVGAVASPLLMMGGAGLGKAGQALSSRLPGGAKRRADAKINALLEDAGISPTQVDDILKANPGLTLGDIAPNMQAAGAQYASPGSAKRLAERTVGARDRIVKEAGENLDVPPGGNFSAILDDVATGAREAAKPLYKAAHAAPLVRTRRMTTIWNSKKGKKAQKIALENLNGKTAAGMRKGPVSEVEMADEFQRALGDMIPTALSKTKSQTKKAVLTGMRANFNKDLLKKNPALEAAQSVWKGSKGFQRAAEEGREAFVSPKRGRRFIQDKYDKLNDTEKQAYKLGLLHSLDEKLAMGGKASDVAKALREKPGMFAILDRAFGGKDKGKAFLRFLEAEGDMYMSGKIVAKGAAENTASRGVVKDAIMLIKSLIVQRFTGKGQLSVPQMKLKLGRDILEEGMGAMPGMNAQMQTRLAGRSVPPPTPLQNAGAGPASQLAAKVAPLEMESQIIDPLRDLL